MKIEPTIRQLRHFLSLAEHCHFGHAADACFIGQSSLSASIKELENILGVVLFERTKRFVMLTPTGHDVVELAKSVLLSVDDLTDAVKGTGAPLSGNLRMGVIPTIGSFLLPRVLPGLRKAYPDLSLYLREDHSAPLLSKLEDGSLDLILLALPYDTGDLKTFEFANDQFLAVFPRGSILGDFETMTPERLKNDALLLLEDGNCLTSQILRMSSIMGKSISAQDTEQFQATSLHTTVQMVDNGLGIAILPKMAVDAGILRGLKLDFRPFSSPNASRGIALAWRKSSRRGEEFTMLGNYLRDELGTPVRQTAQKAKKK